MAMKPSVTVVEVGGDDDDEWGEEEEVVVWSKGVETATAAYGGDSIHGSNGDIDNAAGTSTRDRGGHPRGLLIASLANLAISYNVVCCLDSFVMNLFHFPGLRRRAVGLCSVFSINR